MAETETQTLTLQTLSSKIGELSDFLTNSGDNSLLSASDSEKLLREFILDFQAKADQIVADHSDVADFNDVDLDAYTDRLRAELRESEAECASINQEIESLANSYVEGTCQLESNLESLRHVVDCAESKALRQVDTGEQIGETEESECLHKLATAQYDDSFEISKLKHHLEMNEVTLKSLQELDLNLKRVEAIEKIKEALTGLKVIDVEGNIIRVSLKTYIPNVEGLTASEVNHELLIEVSNGTSEIKNVEISPNDVNIAEIVEAANTFSKVFSRLPVQETRSTLGWFLQKVQDRVLLCTLRRLVLKIAKNSRHSFEYLDKDDLIIAHMTGGIDAYLKPSQGWPLSGSTLKLLSLKSSDQNGEDISLSLLFKVEEVVNSLDFDTRKSITAFVDGIEEILLEKMRPELH